MAYIYQITNDVNGKIYIGKTEQSIQTRFQEHCRERFRSTERPLYRAMNKYGVEHFHIELLEETNHPEERETFWIEQKQSFKNGYNATLGGDGKHYLDYDLIYSTYEALQNATATAKKLNISVDSVYTVVKQRGELKSSQEISREKNSKPVKMFDLSGQYLQSFSCLKDAARYLIEQKKTVSIDLKGITVHIRNCANEKRKTAYGFIWKW